MARQNGPVLGPARSVLCGLWVARPLLPRPAARSRPGPLARAARERPGLLTPLYNVSRAPSNPNPLPPNYSSPADPLDCAAPARPLTLIPSLPIPPPPLPLGWSGSDVLAVGAGVITVAAAVLRSCCPRRRIRICCPRRWICCPRRLAGDFFLLLLTTLSFLLPPPPFFP
jgi:hypothetical protein